MKFKVAAGIIIFMVIASVASAFAGRQDSYYDRPMIDLFYPVTDNIDLTGKAILQFKWRQIHLPETDHFELKIYKGYDMIAANLIVKQDIPVDEYPFELPAEKFQVGEVYTWSLRQVYFDGSKSERSYSPFKIIKK